MSNIRRLDETCTVCEEGQLLRDENKREKFCSECHVVLDKHTFESDDGDDPWVDFFNYRREEYSGFTGNERVKMPGGFVGAYTFESDF